MILETGVLSINRLMYAGKRDLGSKMSSSSKVSCELPLPSSPAIASSMEQLLWICAISSVVAEDTIA